MENQQFLIEDNQVIISLTGELQGDLAAAIRETMLGYIEDGHPNFRLDFSNVSGINSTGLGMLVNIQKRAVQNGGDVALCGLAGIVKAAFDRTRLTRAFTILDSESAVA